MEDMDITSAQYVNDMVNPSRTDHIKAVIEGKERQVPLSMGNRHYSEIMRQVEAGTLVIQDAD